MEIWQYNPTEDKERWDSLVDVAPQATFMHKRAYIDYHGDRIKDFSLLAVDGRGRLLGALPACEVNGVVTSHAGLTYGGWLTNATLVNGNTMLKMTQLMVQALKEWGYKRLIYKPVPTIYHRCPAQDDLYAMWRCGATIEGMNLSSAVQLDSEWQPPFNRGNRSNMSHAVASGVETRVSDDWAYYWHLLGEVLGTRYRATPVHTLEEITRLKSLFPDNIVLHTAVHDGSIVAGVVVYYTDAVAHCQYIAAGEQGRTLRALPLLMHDIMTHARERGCRYLDYGTSNEYGGHLLNESLLEQKARLGGRGVVYPILILELNRW